MTLACWTPREFLAMAEETGFAVVRMEARVGAFALALALDSVGEARFKLHERRPRAEV